MKKKKYKLIVFDVDGTLINPNEGVCNALLYVIRKYKLPMLGPDELAEFNGPPIFKSFLQHFPVDEKQAGEMVEEFRQRYKDYELLKAYVYTGVYNLFNSLLQSDYRIGIATYKRNDYAKKLVEYFGFEQYTDAIYGSDFNNKLLKKDIVLKCINHFNIQHFSQVLMIGDSENDAIAAKELGIDFLGVTYGFGFKKEDDMKMFNPVYCAKTVVEIGTYLNVNTNDYVEQN